MEPEALAAAIVKLVAWAEENAPEPEAPVRARLREHFGCEPAELPVVSRALNAWDRPNFQIAIDAWVAGKDAEVVGVSIMDGYRAGLAELVRGGAWGSQLQLGGVDHVTVPLGGEEHVTCVESGLWLASHDGEPVVIMLQASDRGMGEQLALEVMAAGREPAEAVLAELRRLMDERNVYRGRVLELAPRHFHGDEGAPPSCC